MDQLHGNMLSPDDRLKHLATQQAPVTILQIGEGNFLRGFIDWMIHVCRDKGLFIGSIAVVQPRPSGQAKIQQLSQQQGLYSLVTRGIENGVLMIRKEIISVFSQVFDPALCTRLGTPTRISRMGKNSQPIL